MSRKAIPKKIREQVYQMFDGHCAYCGCKLEYKDMQVDHIKSVYASEWNRVPVDNSIANYYPSCRSCNFYKGTWSLEGFRDNIEHMLIGKLRRDFNYKMLVKYGMIHEDFKPVEFYFERMKRGDSE